MAGKALVDLDELLTEHIKKLYSENQKHMKEKNPFEKLVVNVDKSKFLIHTETPEYKPTSITVTDHSAKKPRVLFKTAFSNPTDHEQRYSLNTERTTRQLATFSATKGFTFGVDCSINLSLPMDIMEANATFKHEIRMDRTMQSEAEELVSWKVDSEIIVPPHTRTTVELVVNELEYRAHFRATSTFSGKILVILSTKDGNEVFRHTIRHFKDAFLENDGFLIDPITKELRFVTEGSCYFKYGAEQSVKTYEEPL